MGFLSQIKAIFHRSSKAEQIARRNRLASAFPVEPYSMVRTLRMARDQNPCDAVVVRWWLDLCEVAAQMIYDLHSERNAAIAAAHLMRSADELAEARKSQSPITTDADVIRAAQILHYWWNMHINAPLVGEQSDKMGAAIEAIIANRHDPHNAFGAAMTAIFEPEGK